MKTLLTLVLLTGLTFAADHSHAADGDLSPSEVTVLINNAMRYQPDAARTSLTRPIVARMATSDASALESFLRGEVHFLNLDPEPARDAFWEFRKQDDIVGRVANQRLLIIRINAFGMVDELLDNDISQYHERFAIRPDDRYGITFAVARTAALLAEQGRADEALDLVMAEVRLHDKFDSPYTAYRLPAQFLELATANNRQVEMQELRAWVISNFEAALQRRLDLPVDVSRQEDRIPGVVFRSMFADQDMDKHDWTAAFVRLRQEL